MASLTSSRHKTEVLQEHCKAVGRDYDEIAKTWSPEVFVRETEQEVIDAGSRSFWGEPFDSWRDGNLVGTPEQVAEKLVAYQALGCSRRRAVVRGLPGNRDLAVVRREGDPELPLSRRARVSRCASADVGVVAGPRLIAQPALHDLAVRVARQLVDELDDGRALVVGEAFAHERLQVVRRRPGRAPRPPP